MGGANAIASERRWAERGRVLVFQTGVYFKEI